MVEIKKYQGGMALRPQAPVGVTAGDSGVDALAKGMGAVGSLFYQYQDEVDTADAKLADNAFSKAVDSALYADGTGYMYAQGGDATARREATLKEIEKRRDEVLNRLSPAARARAEGAMQSRYQAASTNINQHAAGQGREYLNQASSARIESFLSSAVYQPDNAGIEIKRAETEIRDMGAREGWPPEKVELEATKARTKAYSDIVNRIANADPMAAVDYLAKNKGAMLGDEVTRLETALAPMVKDRQGRNLGAAAVSGQPVYSYQTKIDYNMGPARPNKPNKPVVDVVGMAVQDVMGLGARVVITSGQEGPNRPQHGSNRHKSGNAADISIYREDGTRVKSGDPEMAQIAIAAARRGARGIGFGSEYMGGDHMHIDLFEAGAGQSNQWASGASALANDLAKARSEYANRGAVSINDLASIQDPDVRQAALQEYTLLTGIQTKQLDAQRDAATNAAWQILEQDPAALESLTFDEKNLIGMSGMKELRGIAADLASGKKYVTDTQTYVQLRDMAVTSPQVLAAMDPIDFRTQLNDADFKQIMELRAKALEGAQPSANAIKLSEVRPMITTALSTLGKKATEKDGAKMQVQMEGELMRWHDQFVAAAGRAPTQAETHKRIQDLIVPIVVNPAGVNNEQSGAAVSINYRGAPVVESGTVKWQDQISIDDLPTTDITIGGVKVPRGDISAFIDAYRERYSGRSPSVQEVVDGLIFTGEYTSGR